jgi:hypothetical protein
MNPQERTIIDNLFDKLAQAEGQAGQRDPDAESHIRSRMANQPGAPYLMAQTIVMQQQALEAAQTRLAALEDEMTRRPAGGSFLSGLFGGGASGREPGVTPGTPQPQAGVGAHSFGRGIAQAQPVRSGGFLAGAAQTAMGVAGGVLLGSMIGSAFGGGEAQAAETAVPEAAPSNDATDGAADDMAGDAGGFSDEF